jgi:hypothetical protein
MAGGGEEITLTGVRSRAVHRGQCSIVSQDALGRTVRPHRGHVRNDALPLAGRLSEPVIGVSRRRGGSDRLWRRGPVICRMPCARAMAVVSGTLSPRVRGAVEASGVQCGRRPLPHSGSQGKPPFPHAGQSSARPHWVCRFDLVEVAQASRPRSQAAALAVPEPTFQDRSSRHLLER